MKRPQVIRMKSPQKARDRALRSAAMEHATKALTGLEASLRSANDELRVEAYRAVIRLTSKLVADPARAAGILAGAAADVAPAWTPKPTIHATINDLAARLTDWDRQP
ncbi:MAG: hypothetical protein WCO83_02395 [Alphaproteobacteria bacterium]